MRERVQHVSPGSVGDSLPLCASWLGTVKKYTYNRHGGSGAFQTYWHCALRLNHPLED
jgi:hypothetical protein